MCKQSVFLLVPICLAFSWRVNLAELRCLRTTGIDGETEGRFNKVGDEGVCDGGHGGALHRRRHPDYDARGDSRPGILLK